MVAKSGDRLLDAEAVAALRVELLPRAMVVTPNIPEAAALADMAIESIDDVREAARRIHRLEPEAQCVIKGGHAEGAEVIDLLFDGHDFTEFRTVRIVTRNTHGTGCTFASSLAAHLAHGQNPRGQPPLLHRHMSLAPFDTAWRWPSATVHSITSGALEVLRSVLGC